MTEESRSHEGCALSGKRRPVRPPEVAVDEHARQMFIGGLGGSLESPRPINPDHFPEANFLGNGSAAILFKTDEFTLTSAAQTITLTYIPMLHSEHVYLHNSAVGGVYKEEVTQGWTRAEGTKTISITAPLGAQTGDVVVVSYAYYANQPIPTIPCSEALPAEILARSPLAYWRLDEASGSVLVDSSGNGRDLTIVSGTPDAYQAPSVLPGGGGNSINLGSGCYAEAADDAWNSFTSSWSMIVHYRCDTYDSFMSFLHKDNWVYAYGGGYALHVDGTMSYWAGSGNGGEYFVADISAYDDFRQIIVVYDAGMLHGYENGVLLDSWAASAPLNTSGPLKLGASGSNYWYGQDFALWDRALSGDEVAALGSAASCVN